MSNKLKTQLNSQSGSLKKFAVTALFCSAVVIALLLSMTQRPKTLGTPSLEEIKAMLPIFVLPPPPVKDERLSAITDFGESLFFDQRLSSSGDISCASCHQPALGFTDGLPTSVGEGPTKFNSPTLVNAHLMDWFFWDGRADSLAAQALGPLEAANEHNLSRFQVVELIDKYYRDEYIRVFHSWPFTEDSYALLSIERSADNLKLPTPTISKTMGAYILASLPSIAQQRMILDVARKEKKSPARFLRDYFAHTHSNFGATHSEIGVDKLTYQAVNQIFANVGLALAAFQKTIVSQPSPFDQFATAWLAASESELPDSFFSETFNEEAFSGLQVFLGHGQCFTCHFGPLFSDQQFHNLGITSEISSLSDLPIGRARGVALVKSDPFNCLGPYLPASERQSCQSLPYLDNDNLELLGAFKTPTLRHLDLTAPYFHNGSAKTLREVLEHYDRPKNPPSIGHREELLDIITLSNQDKKHLKAFLETLSSPFTFGYEATRDN